MNAAASAATVTIKNGLGAPPPTAGLNLTAISPDAGGDTGGVTITVDGQGIQHGAAVRLTRAGQPDILGGLVKFTPDGTSLTAVVDLTGRARGKWSVIVTNPEGTSKTLPDAFTVEAGRASSVWVDIVGRDVARFGSVVTYMVLVGNRGNTDLYGVPVILSGIPRERQGEARVRSDSGTADARHA